MANTRSAASPKLAPKRPELLSPRGIIGGGICITLFLAGLCVFVLYQSRLDSYLRGEQAARNAVTLIERDIGRNFELYDLSLQAVVEGLADPAVRRLSPVLQRAILFDRAATAKYLGSLLVLDASGNIAIDAASDTPRVGNFSDRDYFTIQRDNPAAGLYISLPFDSRLRHGEPSIALSRRLSNPDGSFAGIVFIAINLRYFQELFAGLTFGSKGSITLIRTDGVIVARLPPFPAERGGSLGGRENFLRLLAAESGSFQAPAISDGIVRLFVFKKIAGLPLIVNVATAMSDIYASWWQRTFWLVIPISLFALVFIALTMMFSVQMRRRLAAEHALELLAHTDGLTGLHNRRTLDDILELEWQRAVRLKRELSVLFIDIDHFKSFNDTYGHQAGDDALVAVVACLSAALLKPADRAARYGGEEFVVLLPDTTQGEALRMAEQMRAAVSQLAIAHARSEFRRVTISVGIANWHAGSPLKHKTLIAAADAALYQAKSTGRNRVALYGEDSATLEKRPSHEGGTAQESSSLNAPR